MQHHGMVVNVVERDELRETALTLGARLCDRVGVRSLRFAKEAIALAEGSERGVCGRDAGLAHGGAPRLRRTVPAARADACATVHQARATNCSTVAISAPKAAA